MNYCKLFYRAIESRLNENRGNSRVIRSRDVLRNYLAQDDSTVLVSFPRTGSHWLRMMLERYFERPSLRRIFFYPDRTDWLSFHTHDHHLDFTHPRVIYLYRDPVDTVYSQMQFCGEPLHSARRTLYWTQRYAANLAKWLFLETFTEKKLVLKYENLRNKPEAEFAKVCDWFGQSMDSRRFQEAQDGLTRKRVDQSTSDRRVVNLSQGYNDQRIQFRAEHADRIRNVIAQHELTGFFEDGDQTECGN